MSRRRWLRREVALVRSSLDVIGLAWVLVVVQGLVPTGNLLAREDLAPWTCLVTCLVVLLRGGPLGRGPHPQLTERQSTRGRLCRRVALGLVPLALFAWFEFGQTLEEGRAWTAAGVTLGGAVLLVLGRGAG